MFGAYDQNSCPLDRMLFLIKYISFSMEQQFAPVVWDTKKSLHQCTEMQALQQKQMVTQALMFAQNSHTQMNYTFRSFGRQKYLSMYPVLQYNVARDTILFRFGKCADEFAVDSFREVQAMSRQSNYFLLLNNKQQRSGIFGLVPSSHTICNFVMFNRSNRSYRGTY